MALSNFITRGVLVTQLKRALDGLKDAADTLRTDADCIEDSHFIESTISALTGIKNRHDELVRRDLEAQRESGAEFCRRCGRSREAHKTTPYEYAQLLEEQLRCQGYLS